MRAFLVTALFAAVLASPVTAQSADTLKDADLLVSGIHTGSTQATVRSAFGTPIKATQYKWTYSDVSVFFDDHHQCEQILLTSPKWSTARGLRVGDSTSRVYELYGDWPSMQAGAYMIYMRSHDDGNDLGMFLDIRAGRVKQITLGIVIDRS